MNSSIQHTFKPEILAPAGSRETFLAALAAGADSIYCGLQNFSARMEAENISLSELCRLSELAGSKNCKTYIAFNSLIKPGELTEAGRLIDQLIKHVQPDALIVQDLAMILLSRQLGYPGQIHLSTLANASAKKDLHFISRELGLQRVILPRELSIDEIKDLARSCPQDLELETFVHGALCYAVSGRCYWSSWLGGKSGLRGRCVQPCRRVYTLKGKKKRYFSCLDLSLDVLSRTLLDIPQIKAWKIEGRKKGPHYVYYTVKAYKLFRDYPKDPEAKKTALEILKYSLGRPSTHYYFLPQKPYLPVETNSDSGSGLLAGRISKTKNGRLILRPRMEILSEDLLRVGYQDQMGHFVFKASKYTPKGGKLNLPPKGQKSAKPGTSVFLIDRREPELKEELSKLHRELQSFHKDYTKSSAFTPRMPSASFKGKNLGIMHVFPLPAQGKIKGLLGIWLQESIFKRISKTVFPKAWFWLPPVIWPQEEKRWEEIIHRAMKLGAKHFVLGSPWQRAFFKPDDHLCLWAGPFCNLANPLALEVLQKHGFSGAFITPELSRQEALHLPKKSPLPLGFVLKGHWPLCISRTLNNELKSEDFVTSPKDEISFIRKQGSLYYIYPNWELDLSQERQQLEEAGYKMFAHLHTSRPARVPKPRRRGSFNWELTLS